MGCTSGKQKRTTSVDDLPGQTKAKSKDKSTPPKKAKSSENGEATTPSSAKDKKVKKEDVEKVEPKKPEQTKSVPIPGTTKKDEIARPKEKATPEKLLLIPGTHTSFMAPDDIPFIDDEVPSDIEEENETDDGLVRNLTWRTSERQSNTSPDKIQDGGAVHTLTNEKDKMADNNPNDYVVSSAIDYRSAPDSRVVQEILKEEVRITSSESRRTDGTDGSPIVATEHGVLSNGSQAEENDKNKISSVNGVYNGGDDEKQLNDAAIKIQSRYKGYKARTQVKSIKKQQHVDDDVTVIEKSLPSTNEQQGRVEMGLNGSHPTETTINEEKAAIRIQSHYKGYKTRRSLKNQ